MLIARFCPRRITYTKRNRARELVVYDGVADDSDIENLAALQLTTIRSHAQYNTTIYGP
jgi:hypothetical protein